MGPCNDCYSPRPPVLQHENVQKIFVVFEFARKNRRIVHYHAVQTIIIVAAVVAIREFGANFRESFVKDTAKNRILQVEFQKIESLH